jgi:hypothetical protein
MREEQIPLSREQNRRLSYSVYTHYFTFGVVTLWDSEGGETRIDNRQLKLHWWKRKLVQ